MSDLFEEPNDATPLTPEEKQELIPAHITYRNELNEAEQENIVRAQEWAFDRRRELLTEKFIKNLHKRMFGDVWRWAGRFRTSQKNIGIPFYEIPTTIRQLLDDTKAWIDYKAYPPDEIAVRFSHRFVQIHPFPNGNGRHSRLMADLIVVNLGGDRFSRQGRVQRCATDSGKRDLGQHRTTMDRDSRPRDSGVGRDQAVMEVRFVARRSIQLS